MIEKTAQFQAFQYGFLSEMEKVVDAQGLSELEKIAIMGRLGKILAQWAQAGGKKLMGSGLEAAGRGVGAGAGRSNAGQWLKMLGKQMEASPELAGGAAMGVGGAGAAGLGAGLLE